MNENCRSPYGRTAEARCAYTLPGSMVPVVCVIAVLLLTTLKVQSAKIADSRILAADEKMTQSSLFIQRGQYEHAVSKLKAAAADYESLGQREKQTKALVKLAVAYQTLGQHWLSLGTLDTAWSVANKTGNRHDIISIKSALGVVFTLLREQVKARQFLDEALRMARQDRERATVAMLLNNSGNLLLSQKKFTEALQEYAECLTSALEIEDHALAAQTLLNAALAAGSNDDAEAAEKFSRQALTEIQHLDASHDKAIFLIDAGERLRELSSKRPRSKNTLINLADQTYQSGAAICEQLGDTRALSYALGCRGHLFENEGQTQEALRLTRKAIFCAQQIDASEMIYRWEWQSGRLWWKLSETETAISAYRRAVQTLQGLRNDIALGYGNRPVAASFREATGSLYFELADLLLKRVDSLISEAVSGTQPDTHPYLLEARNTIELLRSAEMEDYFQDECVSLRRARTTDTASVAKNAAVIYLIPLPDRLELLVSRAGERLDRFKIGIGEMELTQVVSEFRRLLEKRTTYEYLTPARKLHQWLIEPIAGTLEEEHIDTLVFVPDGALRLVPMAALHDGNSFLIERFAVATTPGLTLMEPKPLKPQSGSLLVNALSEPMAGFPALDYVSGETRNLRTNYAGKVLLNREFVSNAVSNELTRGQYSIVHFATHGQFEHDAKKTFLLCYDGRLSMDDLERFIRPGQFRGQPVELLTLSACQTAAGDDRAALGLAGVAIKSGARSALATLWCVNDQAGSFLISEFYSELKKNPSLSKASALRSAQAKLIHDPRYRHPCFWSPYLIIGNWL